MTCATVRENNLPHAVFLRRLAASRGDSLDARLGRGAFLALRLADLLRREAQPVHADAFEYQYRATERLCHELPADDTETSHLIGLVRSLADAFHEQDVQLAVPALLAYGHHLEDQLHLDEALDVLECTLAVGAERLGVSDAVAVHLRMGRVNRKLSRFAEAVAAYALAGELADMAGDVRGALYSRAGQAIALQGRGNLGDAERALRQIVADARTSGQHDIEAGVQHALSTTLLFRGQVAEGILHAWRAFQLYDDEPSRVRALGDVGVMLLALGEPAGAERALLEVVRRGHPMQDVVSNAMIELMHCASYRRDRLGFERWRAACLARASSMPPNILADFHLKAGIGQARFGRFSRARDLMGAALKVAEAAGMNELVFRVERIRSGLRGCEGEVVNPSETAAEPLQRGELVREVAALLAELEA